MKVTDIIKRKISKYPPGYVFTCANFYDEVKSREALIKALNRFAKTGEIAKLSKGRFYKPEQTIFGKLKPSQEQVVKDLLVKNGKVEGYLTGFSIYNEYGLTTQISNIIQIGKNNVRSPFIRGNYKISFVKQKNRITRENISFLRLLDLIRFIKKIPDSQVDKSYEIIRSYVAELSATETKTITNLALQYSPSTRAILGAILTELGNIEIATRLQASLNPITSYNFPEIATLIPSSSKWNIK